MSNRKKVSIIRIGQDKKYSSMSSKLELKGLVKHETASSTSSTLHLSRLNTSFQCIGELLYIEL